MRVETSKSELTYTEEEIFGFSTRKGWGTKKGKETSDSPEKLVRKLNGKKVIRSRGEVEKEYREKVSNGNKKAPKEIEEISEEILVFDQEKVLEGSEKLDSGSSSWYKDGVEEHVASSQSHPKEGIMTDEMKKEMKEEMKKLSAEMRSEIIKDVGLLEYSKEHWVAAAATAFGAVAVGAGLGYALAPGAKCPTTGFMMQPVA